MTTSRHAGFSRWTLIVLATTTLALAGCGRKGGLDLPPRSTAQPAPEVEAAPTKGTLFDPSFGSDGPPAASKGRKKPFLLDPLLND